MTFQFWQVFLIAYFTAGFVAGAYGLLAHKVGLNHNPPVFIFIGCIFWPFDLIAIYVMSQGSKPPKPPIEPGHG